MNEEQATCLVIVKDLMDIYNEVYPNEKPSEGVLSEIVATICEESFEPIYNHIKSCIEEMKRFGEIPLKSGDKYITDCPYCGVKLEFEKEEDEGIIYLSYVRCPECGRQFGNKYIFSEWREISETTSMI